VVHVRVDTAALSLDVAANDLRRARRHLGQYLPWGDASSLKSGADRNSHGADREECRLRAVTSM
jgi:hypothetical protein